MKRKILSFIIPAVIVVFSILQLLGFEPFIMLGFALLASFIFGYFSAIFIFKAPEKTDVKDRIVIGSLALYVMLLLQLFVLRVIGVVSFWIFFSFLYFGVFGFIFFSIIIDNLFKRREAKHPLRIRFKSPKSVSDILFPVFFGCMTAFFLVLFNIIIPEEAALGIFFETPFLIVFVFSILTFFTKVEEETD